MKRQAIKHHKIERIASNTGGGDALGLNAVIRAEAVFAVNRGWECYGIRALTEDQHGIMVARDPPTLRYIPIADATNRMKCVPKSCDIILTARDLGISFGD
jgi:hypothetical protein